MKNNKKILLALLMIGSIYHAEYIIQIQVSDLKSAIFNNPWKKSEQIINEEYSDYHSCESVTPSETEYEVGVSFEQTSTGCIREKTITYKTIETHEDTGEVKEGEDELTRVETETDQKQIKNAVGTNEVFSMSGGVGTAVRGSIKFVGYYARENFNIDTGTKWIVEGDQRIQLYVKVTSNGTACSVNFAVTDPVGWRLDDELYNAEKGTVIAAKYNYVSFMNGNNVALKVPLPLATWIYKQTTMDCSFFNTFYDNPNMYSKIQLSKY